MKIRIKKLFFKADSSKIEPESFEGLDEIAEFLIDNPELVVEVGGHTNGVPDHAYCNRLSTARAKEVRAYFVGKGVNAAQIKYKGYGKHNPIATNRTIDGRRKNQRVELKVLEIKQ